ncbi:MAG: TonB-dependent receptor plug domain-containing protein [Sphingomonadaceae bacterium]|nr:TonB-dependent receptor plug domain-containing protein [Sphingomonadaceae bacterium]
MTKLHFAALVLSVGVAGPAVGAPSTASTPAAKQFYHLRSQPLAASLRAVAIASGLSIIAPAELIGDRIAGRLDGSFSAINAVTQLLAGSGLAVRPVASGLTIDRLDPPSSRGVAPPDGKSEIVVTGSRIRGGRPASPVITLNQADIRRSGQASLGDAVRSIPQSFGGGQNPGVGTNVPFSGGVNLGGGSSINLRGLGSDATLTLLNGHRLSYSASRQSIDVSAIPLDAVERIEIVPDGGVCDLRFGRDRRRRQCHSAQEFQRLADQRPPRRFDRWW